MRTQKIIPTGEHAGWLKAREALRDKGGLPSNVLHDDVLVRSDQWKKLTEYYPAWAREVLVYPAKNGQFRKGEDVVDSFEDEAGRKWIFPASSIPEEAIGRHKVGLFVDPGSVEVTDKKVIISAKSQSAVVLGPFIQDDGLSGIVDDETRVPLESEREPVEDQKRWLYRVKGSGVRPLVRDVYGYYYGRRLVRAGDWLGKAFGVAYVGLEEAAPKVQVQTAPEDQGLLVKGVTLEQFRELVGDANVSLNDLAQTVKPEKLEALVRLAQALEIKK